MRKRMVLGLLVAGAMVAAGRAWAYSVGDGLPTSVNTQFTFCTKSLTADTNAVTDCDGNTVRAGTLIYGFKIPTPNTFCALVDAATVGGSSSTTIIDDADTSSTLPTYESSWPMPYVVTTGLSVDLGGTPIQTNLGACLIMLGKPRNG